MLTRDEILDACHSLGLLKVVTRSHRELKMFITPIPGAHGNGFGFVISMDGTAPPLVFALVPGGRIEHGEVFPELVNLKDSTPRRIRRSEEPAYLKFFKLYNELLANPLPVTL